MRRAGGGRTKSKNPLRGGRKRPAKPGKSRRLRSGSGARHDAPAPGALGPGASQPKLSTFAKKASPQRRRLEVFVPLQRHLYSEERIFLPCPQSRKEIPRNP